MGRVLAAWLLVGSALAAPSATPREVVESAVTRVVSELHDANLNARATEPTHRLPARRRAEITRVAADLFDYEEVARLTLPRYWAVRTPEERAEFVRLFTQLPSYESLVDLLRQRVSASPAADTSRGTSASPRAAR